MTPTARKAAIWLAVFRGGTAIARQVEDLYPGAVGELVRDGLAVVEPASWPERSQEWVRLTAQGEWAIIEWLARDEV